MTNQKQYFSYIRVSTQRQGQTGTSLTEQQAAIERYANKSNLAIVKRFEEQETAARQGRPAFLEMLKLLRRGTANGVIIHKVDRSARNLKDWADLGSLIDSGIEVHFAGESLDLSSRGGRLSADIQAVVASDYIRNLREEVKKGFYGRLKQGLYPRPAPIGYLDQGQGKAKEPDPQRAPFIKQAFTLYATGKYSIKSLAEKLTDLGLRNKSGKKISENGLNTVLKNYFYTGLMKIAKTGEIYQGLHHPLVSPPLFERVQRVLSGKTVDKRLSHYFVFRRLLTCQNCQYKLIAERQKGYVYYRCQIADCPQKTIREELVEKELFYYLKKLAFNEQENRYLQQAVKNKYGEIEVLKENKLQVLRIQIEKCRERLSKLTDFFVDGVIDRELFVEKKNNLVIEEQKLQREINSFDEIQRAALTKTEQFLELANQAYLSYQWGTEEEKRELVKFFTSNFFINGKSVLIKLTLPFEIVVNRPLITGGGPRRLIPRTLAALLGQLLSYFSNPDFRPPPKALGSQNGINPKDFDLD
jgi:DNA invertase Pin-like site-specific DNA recombinase